MPSRNHVFCGLDSSAAFCHSFGGFYGQKVFLWPPIAIQTWPCAAKRGPVFTAQYHFLWSQKARCFSESCRRVPGHLFGWLVTFFRSMFMDFDIIFDGFGHGFHTYFSIVLIVQNPDALWVWASLVVAFGMFLSVSLNSSGSQIIQTSSLIHTSTWFL